MKKAAVLVLFVLVAFFAVVFSTFYGMGGALNSGHSDDEEPTQLTFMNSWGGYDAKAGVLVEILNNFEKENPDVTVENLTQSGDDFLPALKEKIATGNQPDVFGLWPGSDIRNLIAAGKVADLTQLINSDPAWKNSFHDGMWQQVEQNGRIYGLPVELTFEGLFVNKDLFDRYGVKVPTNLDELYAAVAAFKKHNIIPIAFNCKPEGSYIFQNIAMSLGGKAVEHPITNGQIDGSYLDAMKIMKSLYNAGAFPPSQECFSMESNTRDDMFLKQQAAMIVQGSWFIEKCSSKNVELVPFPKMSNDSQFNVVYGLGCGTFYISQKAWDDPNKRKQAIKLLKCLTSRENSVLLAKQTDMVSNVDISSYNINYSGLTQTGLKLIHSATNLVGPPDSYITRSAWENVIIKYFPDMLTGKVSPEELWNRAIAAGAEEK